MRQIWIYNIETSMWMMQNTSGDIPEDFPSPRYKTCSVLVPAPDHSSFHIYVFSGLIAGDIKILDMWVLSIPVFVWIRIDIKGYPNDWPISSMAC